MEDYALVAKYEVIPDDVESSVLYRAARAIYEGKVPQAIQPYWAGGRLIALIKPNGKLRPIVIGESLHRLVGACIIRSHKDEAALFFAPARNRPKIPKRVSFPFHGLHPSPPAGPRCDLAS